MGVCEEYTYDAADNMRSRRRNGGATDVFKVDLTRNRFLAGTPTGVQDTFYDLAGNTIKSGRFSNGSPKWEMKYDGLNKQSHFIVNTPDQTSQQYLYAYGPGDLRLIFFDTANGQRTYRFRGADQKVLREFTVLGWGRYLNASSPGAAWSHKKDFINGPDGILASRSRSGIQRYFHTDHLGTPRSITDANGGLRGRHHYYPFGIEIPLGPQEDEVVAKFTGHERDPSGLSDYMMQRTYFYPPLPLRQHRSHPGWVESL